MCGDERVEHSGQLVGTEEIERIGVWKEASELPKLVECFPRWILAIRQKRGFIGQIDDQIGAPASGPTWIYPLAAPRAAERSSASASDESQ
jgi:hypothetical protein